MSWTQPDPLYLYAPDAASTPRRASIYGFSLNNPLIYLDPDGLDSSGGGGDDPATNGGADIFFGSCGASSVCAAGVASDGWDYMSNGYTSDNALRDMIGLGIAKEIPTIQPSSINPNNQIPDLPHANRRYSDRLLADNNGVTTRLIGTAVGGLIGVAFGPVAGGMFIGLVWGGGKDEGEAGCNVAFAGCADLVELTIARTTAMGTAATAERSAVLGKVITAEGELNTSATVARQLAGQRRFIPTTSILDTIGSGTRVADPQGVAGQFMYRAAASFNGTQGTLEVLVHEESGQIRHVLFRGGVAP